MIVSCAHCEEPCTPVAMVWSELLEPEAVCYECALAVVELMEWITRHDAPRLGPLFIEFIPLLPLEREELH